MPAKETTKIVYCIKCKAYTENKGKLTTKTTKNGHKSDASKYVTVKCKRCGKYKSSF